MDFSVVVPVYGCRDALPELHRRLVETLEQMGKSFELIFVDDHDKQNSWEEIFRICQQDKRVRGIKLSRNFGQIRAITAGLDNAKGDWIVVMDCDLQDRPESIPELYGKACEGFDVVFAKRVDRKDSALTKFLSKSFYKVYEYFTDGTYDASLCNFSISRRIVIQNYCKLREHNRGYTMFIKWLGFRQTAIELVGDERFSGSSSYSFSKKMNMAFELITAQSNKPLQLSIRIGFVISLIAFAFLTYTVLRQLLFNDGAAGWTSLIASIYLMGGIILAAIGVVGLYVGNIFTEVKNRPLYVIEEDVNGEGAAK
ncbi:glycosyltransferase family 2 protein [Enorma massiliensis]|uniref:Glycosyltransferase n=1 Tax=Enorma massiliensis TaxID=1472761 RepID=A0A1Y3U7B3_9ACTN|nr:glycosyltransferase family 2 protein [Enorma massiliensis]OUN44623.1 glycosyltransferase [Enorma massiliensis]